MRPAVPRQLRSAWLSSGRFDQLSSAEISSGVSKNGTRDKIRVSSGNSGGRQADDSRDLGFSDPTRVRWRVSEDARRPHPPQAQPARPGASRDLRLGDWPRACRWQVDHPLPEAKVIAQRPRLLTEPTGRTRTLAAHNSGMSPTPLVVFGHSLAHRVLTSRTWRNAVGAVAKRRRKV
jgi:hypothetical protein